MSRHTSYRGTTIDMDTMRRENEKVPALGNMNVNAKGDRMGRAGTITKTADQLARENHRVQTTVVQAGLKGPVPDAPVLAADQTKVVTKPVPAKTEVELPNGDIVVGDE